MKYYLMHKDIKVALIEFNEDADIVNIALRVPQYMPVGCALGMQFFKSWWRDRAVPKTRHGINTVLKKFNLTTTRSLLLNNLGLSLTDCYWVCPMQAQLTWAQVNLFSNKFQDVVGDITFDVNTKNDIRRKTKFSPGASTQGELKKKWVIDSNGLRVLVKGNYGNTYQQSLNEVFISEINRLQDTIPYTSYYTCKLQTTAEENAIGCYSVNFCDENVEFFSAWSLLQDVKKSKSESCYETIYNAAVQRLGMDAAYVQRFLDYEILLDFVTSNLDRHLNNIGFLRDSNTLRVIGFAPIYDCGNSMFWKQPVIPTGAGLLQMKTCSFVEKEVRLLRYVKDRKVFDIGKLPTEQMFYNVYNQENPVYAGRIDKIKQGYLEKMGYLEQFQNGTDLWKMRKDGKMYY